MSKPAASSIPYTFSQRFNGMHPLPVAEELYEKGICLPVHQGLGPSDIDEICEIIRKVHSGL